MDQDSGVVIDGLREGRDRNGVEVGKDGKSGDNFNSINNKNKGKNLLRSLDIMLIVFITKL